MQEPLLEFKNVEKRFGKNYALRGVNFEVFPNECIALVGENGAGKSTLMKILSGVWPVGTYEGEVYFKGQKIQLMNTLEGRESGISIIHQELCLFPELSVAENLFLTEKYPYQGKASKQTLSMVHWKTLYQRAEELFSSLGFELDPYALIKDLSVAERQLVEIAKAFHQKATLLILDEPSSALSDSEVESLYEVIRKMKNQMSFIYISHKLDEVFALSNRIIVLRDGKSVAELITEESSAAEIIEFMVGRPLLENTASEKTDHSDSKVVLETKNLRHKDGLGKVILDGIDLSLREGEVLGIAGLMGAGRSELLRSIVGVLPGNREGEVLFNGNSVSWSGMEEAMDAGVAFVPEDRKKDGLFLDHSIGFNMSVSVLKTLTKKWGGLDLNTEMSLIDRLAKQMRVKCASYSDPVKVLSGGNQQKVLLAKMMATEPKVLFLDEPTRGIDVGAKEEIYSLIRELAKAKIAVVLVSSELPEVLALSDRVMVIREGKQMGVLENVQLEQTTVMSYAAGEVNGNC